MWFIRAAPLISRLFTSQNISSCFYAVTEWVQCLGGAETVHWKGTSQRLHHHVTFSRHKCITWLCSGKLVAILWFGLNRPFQRYSQTSSQCKVFRVKMSLICCHDDYHVCETHFQMNCFAGSLVLRQRQEATRKGVVRSIQDCKCLKV